MHARLDPKGYPERRARDLLRSWDVVALAQTVFILVLFADVFKEEINK